MARKKKQIDTSVEHMEEVLARRSTRYIARDPVIADFVRSMRL